MYLLWFLYMSIHFLIVVILLKANRVLSYFNVLIIPGTNLLTGGMRDWITELLKYFMHTGHVHMCTRAYPPPPHTHTQSVLCLHQMEDGSFVMNFPLEMGSITGYSGRRKDTEIFYRFISFLSPGIIYRCDMAQTELKPEVSLWRHVNHTRGVLFWWGGGRPAPEIVHIHKKLLVYAHARQPWKIEEHKRCHQYP